MAVLSGRAFFERVVNNWKDLALRGIESGENVNCSISGDVSRVIIAGMGGSGLVGDFLADLSSYYSFPFEVVTIKGDFIPFKLKNDDLVILVSYSGNTLETLSIYNQIRELKNWIAVTSGGELLSRTISSGNCAIRLTEGFLPRLDLPEILFSIASLLGSRLGVHSLSKNVLVSSLSVFDLEYSSKAKQVAKSILETIPVFITSRPYFSVGIRIKNDLAENSKLYSTVELIPEASHNTIESFTNMSKPLRPFIIEGRKSEQNIFLLSFTEAIGHSIERIMLEGKSLLEELLYGYKLSTLISLEASSARMVDPYETGMIEKYKKLLRRKIET